jgi:hypothetical protein
LVIVDLQLFILKIAFALSLGFILLYGYNYLTDVDFKKDAENGIQFHKGTWREAVELAKKENKPIFLISMRPT